MAVGNRKTKAPVPQEGNAALLTDPDSGVGLMALNFDIPSVPVSATTLVRKVVIPCGFEVVGVAAWARTPNGGTVQVQVNEVNLLTAGLAPSTTTAVPAQGALPTQRTSRRGNAGQSVGVTVTSGGTSPVDLSVTVMVRPFPMNGEGTQSAT